MGINSYFSTSQFIQLSTQLSKMKTFAIPLAAVACAATAATLKRSSEETEVELQNIFEIIGKLAELGIDFVCNNDISAIIEALQLPADIAGLIDMGKAMLCGGRGQ